MEGHDSDDLRRESLPIDGEGRLGAVAHRRLNSALPFFVTKLHDVANNLNQKLQSASELLIDPDLRRKGATMFREGVKQGIEKGATALGKGIEQGRQTISNGPRTLQQYIENVQERLKQQHWERQLILQKDEPVDVQIAHKLYEQAPQHLRTNFWLALLEKPELVIPLKQVYNRRTASYIASGNSFLGNFSSQNSRNQQEHPQQLSQKELSLDMKPLVEVSEGAKQWESLWEETNLNDNQQEQNQEQYEGGEDGAEGEGNGWEDAQDFDTLTSAVEIGPAEKDAQRIQNFSSPQEQPIKHPLMSQSQTEVQQLNSNGHDLPTNNEPQQSTQDNKWVVVKDAEWVGPKQGYRNLPSSNRTPPGPLLTEDELILERAAIDPLMEAVFLRPESDGSPQYFDEEGESIPYPPMSQYAWLLDLERKQDEVEEVIRRDITRTFPRVPQFELLNTQKALFNVLRAYAQHDPEVGYCQGMAFIAGMLLMYLDQEPAFRLFCRLMEGVGLRKYYLPDLAGFKNELVKFEFLFNVHLPQLFEHMQAHGALAVLFAAPWFMTSFAACLPPAFSARIIDVMLVTETDAVLHQMGIAILQELESELLQLGDMESLCNYVKDEPSKWTADSFRRVFRRVTYSVLKEGDLEKAEYFAMGDGNGEFGVENPIKIQLQNEFSSEMMEVVQDSIERAWLTQIEDTLDDSDNDENDNKGIGTNGVVNTLQQVTQVGESINNTQVDFSEIEK